MTLFVLACMGVVVAAAGLLRLAFPPRPDLVASVNRWERDRARVTERSLHHLDVADTMTGRASAWVVTRLSASGRDLTRLRQDLALTGGSLEGHITRMTTLAAVGLLAPPLIAGLFTTLGLGLPVTWGLAAGVALGATMPIIVHRELRATAEARRAEFRRSLSIYLDLVAMSMESGRGHAEALPAAAGIASGWTFTALGDAISGARYSGTTPWRALGDVGRRLGAAELVDLEAALALAVDDGAQIRATLVARAQSMRGRRVADTQARAAQATESMRFALIVMVFAFLSYEMYPPVVRLFGGG